MPVSVLTRLRTVHVAVALAAAAVVGFSAWAIDRSESREYLAARRLHVQGDLSAVRARLEMELNSRIHLAHGLEALATVKPNLSQAEFQTFARMQQEEHEGIRSLQLARGGVVSHVYPEAGNEAAMGHSLLADPQTAQAARTAIFTRSLVLAGPYALRQGGEGLVARTPVFIEDQPVEQFWGFATVVIDFPTLMHAAGMTSFQGTEFALRGRDGTGGEGPVFHGAAEIFAGEHIATGVRFPNGSWQLAARPVGGWEQPWPGRGWFLLVSALALAAIPVATFAVARASRLRDQSESLRLRDRLLNGMAEGVYGLDVSGRCTFVNAAALRALQFARGEIIGATPALFNGPDGDVEAGASFERRLRRRDGTTFPAEITVAATEEAQGFVVAFSDITARRVAEERLRLSATVFARTQQGIVITDSAARILDVNPAFSEITGYSREEALGRTPRLLRSGRHGPDFYAAMHRSLGKTGFWRGEIWNRHKSGAVYPELLSIAAVDDEQGTVTHYIGVFSDITRQKQHEVELARIAHYDALTGLPNRALLNDRFTQALEHARRTRSRVAVCMLDLDRFKAVNDQYGHDAGDTVLMETASRLKATLRPADTVARLGGDEFVLLLLDVESPTACDALAHRILTAVSAPIRVGIEPLSVSASLGITMFPEDASDPDTLLRHADRAMYGAKDAGRNAFRLFDAEQDRQARTHRETLERIGVGIAQGEFRLHYQPKVDMRSGRVVGFEALARWQHPAQGLLGPADFLRVIEGTPLDIELGRWVLGEALNQLAEWRAGGLDFGVSVNISVTQLLAPGFAGELRLLLLGHPMITPDALEIEVLETAAIVDLDAASQVLRECLDLGVSVALDDFGTGYSSLAYFRRLPVRTLKIDQIFVRDMLEDLDDMAIVEGIIRFARAFDRQLVAEGVQHGELCHLLLAMGCDIVQGYAIAPPMPVERVADWCRHFRPNPEWATVPRCHAEELQLLAAELQHRRWVDEVCASLLPDHGRGTPPALGSHECGLGRWYDTAGAARHGSQRDWTALMAAHESVHDRVAAILSTPSRDGDAAARIAELVALRDELSRCLRTIRKAAAPAARLIETITRSD
ncbi:MAG: EAL domain-containing protein [Betaproteobacteria bacterium]